MKPMLAQSTENQASQSLNDWANYQKYLLILKRRWKPALTIASLVIGMGLLAALLLPRMYRAEGRVLLKIDRTTKLTGLNKELGELQQVTYKSDPLETQVAVVKSASVLQEVLHKLQLRQKNGQPMTIERFLKKLSVKPLPGTDILQISYDSTDAAQSVAIVNQIIDSYRQQNLTTNQEDTAAAAKFLDAQLPASEAQVRRLEETLRQYQERYQIVALNREADNTVSVMSSVAQNLTQVRSQLADVDARLVEAQRQLQMGLDESLDTASLSQSEGVQTAVRDLQAVQAEIAKEGATYQDDHPILLELRDKEANLMQLLETRVGQVSNRPELVDVGSLQSKSANVKQELVADYARLAKERMGLTNQMLELNRSQQTIEQRAALLPRLAQGQRELERQLKAAQTTYETLLDQRQKVRVAETQAVGNVKVLSAADMPEKSIGPNRKLILSAALLGGGLLAIATALGLELLDGSVKSIREVQDILGYPILGVIPKTTREKQLAFLRSLIDPNTFQRSANYPEQLQLRDSYQMLYANLKFLCADRQLRTLAVSSAMLGEGKSQVAATLAAVLADEGRRVLLIDTDLRHPHQVEDTQRPNLFDVSFQRMGLSHVLMSDISLQEAIQHSRMPNVDVLTPGEMPVNPVTLLDSTMMETLLQQCAADYDMVILDTPPLLGCPETTILGQVVDGMLLVVRPESVNYSQLTAVQEVVVRSRPKILGVAVNDIDWRSNPDSYSHIGCWEHSPSASESLLFTKL